MDEKSKKDHKMGAGELPFRMRTMTHADISIVLEIERPSFPHAPWRNGNSFLDGKQGRAFVIIDLDQRVVGYLVIKGNEDDNAFNIIKMATHPNHLGKGIGRFALAQARELATIGCAKELFLRVRQSNTRAHKLYIDAGFKELRLKVAYYKSGKTSADRAAWEMQYTLPAKLSA